MNLDRVERCEPAFDPRRAAGTRDQRVVEATGGTLADVQATPVAGAKLATAAAAGIEGAATAVASVVDAGEHHRFIRRPLGDQVPAESGLDPGLVHLQDQAGIDDQAPVEPALEPRRSALQERRPRRSSIDESRTARVQLRHESELSGVPRHRLSRQRVDLCPVQSP